MTRGGPLDSTKTLSFFVYQESFSYLRAGSGAVRHPDDPDVRPADRPVSVYAASSASPEH
jgi:hypothetical protein